MGALERRAALVLGGLAVVLIVAYVASRRIPPKPRAFDVAEVMVPVRDGVKLRTVIFTPRKAQAPLPLVLVRLAFSAPTDEHWLSEWGLGAMIEDGYIFVWQTVRGGTGSEGVFVDNRPPRDRTDGKATDEGTDAYDTIEWLLHNVPNNDGRVGMWGPSHMGRLAMMPLVDPHPAVRCIAEQAAEDDLFRGDDYFHNGVLHLSEMLDVGNHYPQQLDIDPDPHDLYAWFLQLGALSHVDERLFHGRSPVWNGLVAHPRLDEYWHQRALGSHVTSPTVPILHTAGWWDQEDFFGPFDLYARLEADDPAHRNYLVVGPWFHGQWIPLLGGQSRTIGDVDLGADRAREYREGAERRWFAHWLHDAPGLDLPEALVFETGSNRWRSFDHWPPREGVTPTRLYLRAAGRLTFDAPDETGAGASDAYVSDPANPVPYAQRPIGDWDPDTWMVQDQRFADHRPDVLGWQTDVLDHDVVVAGDIVADLYASTSGTDSDWVVKLIDVYPEQPPPSEGADGKPAKDMRGYELMIAAEIVRARFRDGLDQPKPVPPGQTVHYAIDLHTHAHAFLRGHRIMVQVQSSWFPAFDRNPQRYVENLFLAHDDDFISATQHVLRSREASSSLVLPVVEP